MDERPPLRLSASLVAPPLKRIFRSSCQPGFFGTSAVYHPPAVDHPPELSYPLADGQGYVVDRSILPQAAKSVLTDSR